MHDIKVAGTDTKGPHMEAELNEISELPGQTGSRLRDSTPSKDGEMRHDPHLVNLGEASAKPITTT